MKLVRNISFPKKDSLSTVSREMDAPSPPENYLREGWKLKAKLGKEGGAPREEKQGRKISQQSGWKRRKLPFTKFSTLKRGEVGAEDLEYRTEEQSWRRREMWEVLRYWLLRSVAPLPQAHTYMRVEQSKPTCNGRRLTLEGSIFASTSSFYIGCEWEQIP